MSGGARNFNNIEMGAVVNFFLQGKVPKEIHAILTETLVEHHCMPPSKTGWPCLNVAIFHLSCASSWTSLKSDHTGDY
jgi:hypothetical protein